MLKLRAKIREKFGRKVNSVRKAGKIPAVLYGEEIKNTPLEVNEKEFVKLYQEAGESSLVSLEVEGENAKKIQVLIHQVARHPLTGKFLHIDFYHPSSRKEVEAEIPLIFEGEAPAVKKLGGTLVREIQYLEVKGLPQNLPREIKVNIAGLKTFDDKIQIKDLEVPSGVKILKEPQEIVANVIPQREEEEEVKPIEGEKPIASEEKPAEERASEKVSEEKEGEKK